MSRCFLLTRRVLKSDEGYVRLFFESTSGRYKEQYLKAQSQKRKTFFENYTARLESFTERIIVEETEVLFYMENAVTFLTTQYFTLGILRPDRGFSHKIVNFSAGTPVYVYLCSPEWTSQYDDHVNKRHLLVDDAEIASRFRLVCVRDRHVIPEGTVYFFYTVSHSHFVFETVPASSEGGCGLQRRIPVVRIRPSKILKRESGSATSAGSFPGLSKSSGVSEAKPTSSAPRRQTLPAATIVLNRSSSATSLRDTEEVNRCSVRSVPPSPTDSTKGGAKRLIPEDSVRPSKTLKRESGSATSAGPFPGSSKSSGISYVVPASSTERENSSPTTSSEELPSSADSPPSSEHHLNVEVVDCLSDGSLASSPKSWCSVTVISDPEPTVPPAGSSGEQASVRSKSIDKGHDVWRREDVPSCDQEPTLENISSLIQEVRSASRDHPRLESVFQDGLRRIQDVEERLRAQEDEIKELRRENEKLQRISTGVTELLKSAL